MGWEWAGWRHETVPTRRARRSLTAVLRCRELAAVTGLPSPGTVASALPEAQAAGAEEPPHLDISCGPHGSDSVQVLVAAGEHHVHSVVAFAYL